MGDAFKLGRPARERRRAIGPVECGLSSLEVRSGAAICVLMQSRRAGPKITLGSKVVGRQWVKGSFDMRGRASPGIRTREYFVFGSDYEGHPCSFWWESSLQVRPFEGLTTLIVSWRGRCPALKISGVNSPL